MFLSLLHTFLFGSLSVVLLLVSHDNGQLIILIFDCLLVFVSWRSLVVFSLMGGWGLMDLVQVLEEFVVLVGYEVQTARLAILLNEILKLSKDLCLRHCESIDDLKVL